MQSNYVLGATFALIALSACAAEEPAPPPAVLSADTLGVIERLDPEFDRLVGPDAVIERLADGFDWSEGPVWIPSEGVLLFSDVPQNVIFRWKDGEGITEYLRPSGYTGSEEGRREPGSNGLALDLEERLLLCQHGDRRVARLEADGSFTMLASHFEGKRLNSPNDLVVHSSGTIYFTDPPYGLKGLNESPEKELTFNGVYRISPGGELQLLIQDLTFPNGIALSPDEKTLYIAVSDPANPVVMAYALDDQGLPGAGRVFFDFSPSQGELPGLPDGLKVDAAGNVFTTAPGGVSVLSASGTLLGRFNTGVATANCGWGGSGSDLYITADSYLCRVRLTTRGFLRW